MTRLGNDTKLREGVEAPAYDRDTLEEGIVHLGFGAFHKAHQALYTDDALAAEGGDWRIHGVSLRSSEAVDALRPQDGLYTLVEADATGVSARVIGSVGSLSSFAHGDAERVRAALAAPGTRIVTLTVTEKGYGIDRDTGGVDPDHPAIAHDLAHPDDPQGVAGLLTLALRQRRDAGTPPFTILCCDNLPENGALVRGLILDFGGRTAPELRDWIAENVAFPSSMVDRITPAATSELLDEVREMIGCEDHAPIRAERFRQWVIEDRFPQGRPAWDRAGALLVDDVAPYEHMKLRMLNGAHSMLAYAGFVGGHKYVRDVMADGDLAALVRRHLKAAAATLAPLEGVDFATYAEDLAARFENPHLGHETYQIAMDGTEKLPQRIFAPARDALAAGQDLRPFAFATAAWMRYCTGRTEEGEEYALRDPREDEIRAALEGVEDPRAIAETLLDLPRLVPQELRDHVPFREAVAECLSLFVSAGAAATIGQEARRG